MKLLAIATIVLGCSKPPAAPPPAMTGTNTGSGAVTAAGTNANAVPSDCEARHCPRGTYCVVQHTGAEAFEIAHGSPGFSVNCEPVPPPCTATPTCACIATVGGFGNCFEAAWGLEIRNPPPP